LEAFQSQCPDTKFHWTPNAVDTVEGWIHLVAQLMPNQFRS
jgi:hypothetical protein